MSIYLSLLDELRVKSNDMFESIGRMTCKIDKKKHLKKSSKVVKEQLNLVSDISKEVSHELIYERDIIEKKAA